jgi:hypothetical protein
MFLHQFQLEEASRLQYKKQSAILKIKFTLEQAVKTQWESRGIALLFL